MAGDELTMSQRERDRLRVMSRVLEGKRSQKEAAGLLGLSVRQVRRLERRLELEGDRGIIHRLRSRPSNARRADGERDLALELCRQEFADFGPTLAAEKLAERGVRVSVETLRGWLLSEGLWERRRKRDVHRQRRDRRECLGELVQADGSHHDWLEGRGPRMVLVAMIDDATSRLTARFYPGETTEGYMDLLGRYVRRHGRMTAMYVDRDSVFRAESGHREDPYPAMTQFSRALGQLQIQLILAGSPQAKGRIERSFQTAQDRLVKELRLAGACTLEEANEVLERKYLPWFNRQCVVKPSSLNNAHLPLHPSMHLESILSIQTTRKVCNDYTIRLDNRVYQLLPPALPGERGGQVTIEKRLDGSMHIRFRKTYLAYRMHGAGALPPLPRSLSHVEVPAGQANDEGCVTEATQPSAVHLTTERSGRTPALPCPLDGLNTLPKPQRPRPGPNHPWRGRADISIWSK